MNDKKTAARLNSIGKAAFINYFHVLSDNKITDQQKINVLMKQYDYDGAAMRVSFYNQISKANQIREALKIIENAKRVDKSIRKRASDLIRNF
ncbi:hypothetical protein [Paenibacillus sp. FSL H3-0333]|uniref:hypothetical protein n=1 Tax=Paenibacillus sp. FSL H3-0333 TaxID=2921373 RepID=UPI0030F8A188